MRLPRHDWRDAVYCDRAARSLSVAFDLPAPAAALLAARGIVDTDAAAHFLSPRLAALSDPLEMTDAARAVDRMVSALAASEAMVVYADFDADGVSAAAVLAGVLHALGGKVSVFHPDRIQDGYGLSQAAIIRCLDAHPDARLILTVDCGIRSHAEVDFLIEQGRDVIVTDHHEPLETLPRALAVVNPWRDSNPELAGLAGVGVAFKLCHALVKHLRLSGHSRAAKLDLRQWLDIVAVGTVADVVPLRGENRTLVSAGLQRLCERPSPGLSALMRRAGLHAAHVGSHELGFVLGPRLNAAGRMAGAETASALLMTDDVDLARRHAGQLEQLNALRRGVERDIHDAALTQLAAFDVAQEGAVTVAAPDWHPGAIGIVAARLAERYQRPAAVIALAPDGSGRGSIRSSGEVNLLASLRACEPWLTRAGGHRAAAGMSLKAGCLEAFRAAFSTACRGQGAEHPARSVLQIDGWLQPDAVHIRLLEALRRLEPFGEGHPMPCWALAGMDHATAPRRIGRDGAHLRLCLRRKDEPPLEVIGFHFGACTLPSGPLDVAGTLSLNRWQGQTRLQFRLLDLRPSNGTQ